MVKGFGETKRGAKVVAIETIYNEKTESTYTIAHKSNPKDQSILISEVAWFIFE